MYNPFEQLEQKLSKIENLLLDILVEPKQEQPTTTEPQDEFMTIREAAKFLNLAVPTMYAKVSKNEVPFMKRGKKLHFSRTDLIEFLKSGRNKTNDEIIREAETELLRNKKG